MLIGSYWLREESTGGTPDPFFLYCHRKAPPEVEDLFNVVNQAVEHPLYVDFDLSPQCESIKSFVHSDVSEDRLYYFEALAVDGASLRGVDLLLHSV